MPGMKRVFLVALVAIITLAIFQLVWQATGSVPLAQAGALLSILVGGFLNLIYVSLERIRLEPPKR